MRYRGVMERSELVGLLSPESLRLLYSIPPYESAADIVRTVTDLRKRGYEPSLVATVLSQAKLRVKARIKFTEFADHMLFTEAGLEQATRLRVAALHADRYESAGLRNVVDLGCGIGGDAMALAGLGLRVTAVERDEVTAAIAAYNLATFPDDGESGATVLNDDATTLDLSPFDAAYLDPARRTAGHTNTRRVTDPGDYEPPLAWALALAERMPVGIKLGPGIDRRFIPDNAEAQWISADNQVVEMGLWFGALSRPGVRRSALVLGRDSTSELTGLGESVDEPVGTLGEYLYEPDGAIIRAQLVGDLVRNVAGRMISQSIAYFTSDRAVDTPFATRFRVQESFGFDIRTIGSHLRERGIGTLEIKKRGADIDPAALRKRLSLRGPNEATLVVTRIAGRHAALLVERA